jgi:hypothetical protein
MEAARLRIAKERTTIVFTNIIVTKVGQVELELEDEDRVVVKRRRKGEAGRL